jgi:phosphatidylserine/phosphatidylglycerophosphate/cardiolipin synthase-like enzyme
MNGPSADRLDSLVGDGIEALVTAKHRLRLRRLGWEHALDPSREGIWAQGDPSPRQGCSLQVLIDGAEAFGQMVEAIKGAREFVHITGWHLEPAFELVRGPQPEPIGSLLAELALRIDVRVLVWSGSPLPAFHPNRAEVQAGISNLTRGTQIRCEADPREHPLHCHHEKTVMIDGELAFVNGIDMTDAAGDRFDTQAHRARRRIGWHDVGTRLTGPAVADVGDHFALRWRELTGESVPNPSAPAPTGTQTVQVVRTVANGMYDALPNGEFRILETYLHALRGANRLVYLENQFLWAPEIVRVLADKLRDPPHPDFRIVVLLPAKPNNGGDDTRGQLGILVQADGDDRRLLAATIRSLSEGREDPLYVHAKVAIIDDRWLIVGSANLNAHSLFNDTEMDVVTDDGELARQTRIRLWSEHLQLEAETVAAIDVRTLVDEHWRPIAQEQLERRRSGAPATHRLLALPGVSRRSGRLLGPLQGLVDDG